MSYEDRSNTASCRAACCSSFLCLALNISVYMNYQNSLYDRHQAYIRDLLHFVTSDMDVDDLKNASKPAKRPTISMNCKRFLTTSRDD